MFSLAASSVMVVEFLTELIICVLRRSRETGSSMPDAVFQSCFTTASRYEFTTFAVGWSSGRFSARILAVTARAMVAEARKARKFIQKEGDAKTFDPNSKSLFVLVPSLR